MSKSHRPWPIQFHPLAFEPLLGSLSQVIDAPPIEEVIAAAYTAIDEIVAGKLTGKELGKRYITGDLTGLLRIRFDVDPTLGNTRFRVVYAITGQASHPPSPVIRIISLGPRAGHIVYLGALENLRP